MCLYRRFLEISWLERVNTIEVLRRMKIEEELLITMKKRIATYFGYTYFGTINTIPFNSLWEENLRGRWLKKDALAEEPQELVQ